MRFFALFVPLNFLFVFTLARNIQTNFVPRDVFSNENKLARISELPKVITTPEGDVFDCVKKKNQQGLTDPRLNNHKLQSDFQLPKLGGLKLSGSLTSLPSLDCPNGTIPQMRLRASNPKGDRFFHKAHGDLTKNTTLKFVSSTSTTTTVDAGKVLTTNAYGIVGEITIWKPSVENAQAEFSGSFVSVQNGNDAILAGWLVHPGLYGDSNPRFTIANTNDGFSSNTCYNAACGFVVQSQEIGLGLRFAEVSTQKSRRSILVVINQDASKGGWVLNINQKVIVGYWPNSLFKNLNSGVATSLVWAGRVGNSYPSGRFTKTQMGNGILASSPTSASIESMFYLDDQLNLKIGSPTDLAPTKCYTVSPISTNDKGYPYFYYGGAGSSTGCTESKPPSFSPSPPPPSPLPSRDLSLKAPNPPKSRNKFFRYASYRFTGTANQPNWDLTASIDYTKLAQVGEIEDQGECNACWAMATGAALESVIAITMGGFYGVSKQQILDCAKAKGAGSCDGGWPTNAFEFMVTNGVASPIQYPYIGNNQECQTTSTPAVNTVKISMYEEINFYGSFGLLLAVQSQPVVVNLQASSNVFQTYPGGLFDSDLCFTDFVDHTVLVVGYNFFDMKKPYWILRNSFGEQWGDKGYMQIAYTGGDGICGMHVTPAYYPLLPANFLGSSKPCGGPNPCGGGKCTVNKNTGRNICKCPVAFVAVTSIDGSQTCAAINQCETKSYNPCGNGMCVNNQAGGYTCICPPGFAQKFFADVDENTCEPATSSDKQLFYTSQGKDTCRLIWSTFRLTEAQFLKQNPGLKCANLKPNTRVNVTQSANWKNCEVSYTWNTGDKCTDIESLFGISRTTLSALNPGLECTNTFSGLQVCVREGARMDYDPPCAQFYDVQKGDTCESIIASKSINPFTFFMYNRGINCRALAPQTKSNGIFSGQVCIDKAYLGAGQCNGKSRKVARGDTCASIIIKYFKKSFKLFKKCNKRLICTRLKVGTPYCIC